MAKGEDKWLRLKRSAAERSKGKEERRREEVQKLYFESFKQITTLSTAATLIALALYRETDLSPFILLLPILGFGVALLVSLDGMLGIVSDKLTDIRPRRAPFLLVVAYITFFIGMISAVGVASAIYGYVMQLYLLGFVMLSLAVVYLLFRKRL